MKNIAMYLGVFLGMVSPLQAADSASRVSYDNMASIQEISRLNGEGKKTALSLASGPFEILPSFGRKMRMLEGENVQWVSTCVEGWGDDRISDSYRLEESNKFLAPGEKNLHVWMDAMKDNPELYQMFDYVVMEFSATNCFSAIEKEHLLIWKKYLKPHAASALVFLIEESPVYFEKMASKRYEFRKIGYIGFDLDAGNLLEGYFSGTKTDIAKASDLRAKTYFAYKRYLSEEMKQAFSSIFLVPRASYYSNLEKVEKTPRYMAVLQGPLADTL